MDSEVFENGDGEQQSAPGQEEIARLEGDQLIALVEALILSHGEPLEVERIAQVAQCTEDDVREIMTTLTERYQEESAGFEIVCIANRYQFRTKGKFASYLQALKASRPRRLTPAALETLSVVAYRQPIIKSDIEKIRGVDATPTLKTLLERGLIKIVGHQSTPGQPALYGTTDEFLNLFGLGSLGELPTLRDIRELERDPGEVEENGDEEEVAEYSADSADVVTNS